MAIHLEMAEGKDPNRGPCEEEGVEDHARAYGGVVPIEPPRAHRRYDKDRYDSPHELNQEACKSREQTHVSYDRRNIVEKEQKKVRNNSDANDLGGITELPSDPTCGWPHTKFMKIKAFNKEID